MPVSPSLAVLSVIKKGGLRQRDREAMLPRQRGGLTPEVGKDGQSNSVSISMSRQSPRPHRIAISIDSERTSMRSTIGWIRRRMRGYASIKLISRGDSQRVAK